MIFEGGRVRPATGTLEYSNIKDKDYSSNAGGGINLGKDSNSANIKIGYSDNRQTNFATIGEGTIIVKDSSDISGLNRDVSVSQYHTKSTGLQTGVTVDTATVDLLTKPVDTISDAIDKTVQGGKAAWDTTLRLEKEIELTGEKTGNLLATGNFVTNSELAILQDNLKQKEVYSSNDSDKQLQSRLDEYKKKIDSQNELNQEKADKGKWYSVFDNSQEAVDYINTKKQLGLALDNEDAKLLMQTLWQNTKSGQLASEFKLYVEQNKEDFNDLGIKGLDVNNPKSVNKFVDDVIKNTCVLNTVYGNIVLSSVDSSNVPQSYGDMYLTAYKGGLIQNDGKNIYGYVDDLNNIQKMANTLVGDNRFTVAGATTYGGKLSVTDVYNYIPTVLAESNTLASGGRITGHSMLQYTSADGTVGVYDTGRPNNPKGPREYGTEFNKIYDKDNTKSIWVLTPNN